MRCPGVGPKVGNVTFYPTMQITQIDMGTLLRVTLMDHFTRQPLATLFERIKANALQKLDEGCRFIQFQHNHDPNSSPQPIFGLTATGTYYAFTNQYNTYRNCEVVQLRDGRFIKKYGFNANWEIGCEDSNRPHEPPFAPPPPPQIYN